MKFVQIAVYLGTKFLLSVGRPSRYKPSLELRVGCNDFPQYVSGKWGDHSEIIYVISLKSLILYFRSSRSAPLMA
jgi:hypothetical protein